MFSNKQLRICVLDASKEHSTSVFNELDPYAQPQVYDTEGRFEWHTAYIAKQTAEQTLLELSRQGFDVFLNLCDGAADEDRAGKEVVEVLERLRVPFTGADSSFYEPSKVEMKEAARAAGVDTPAWLLIHPGEEPEATAARSMEDVASAGLKYPLIVKHPSGYSSVGMSRDSRVERSEDLEAQVLKALNEFGGALVEEFIEGREFTVLVSEVPGSSRPHAYLPVECMFSNGETFKHFDLKWIDYESIRWVPCADPELDVRLRRAAEDAFTALKGVSYGRADFRVDMNGTPQFLEMNPNCGIFYPPDAKGSADYILELDPETNPLFFLATIFNVAIARQNRKVD